MPDETHKLQKDPPEGSRKVVENELERNLGNRGARTEETPDAGTESGGEAGRKTGSGG